MCLFSDSLLIEIGFSILLLSHIFIELLLGIIAILLLVITTRLEGIFKKTVEIREEAGMFKTRYIPKDGWHGVGKNKYPRCKQTGYWFLIISYVISIGAWATEKTFYT